MLPLKPLAVAIAAALICTGAATAQPASDKPAASGLTAPDLSVSPRKKASNKARPDALEYSSKIWPPHMYWIIGSTSTANTPYGKLHCMSVGGGRRVCSWQ
jgi:hypothetical protein